MMDSYHHKSGSQKRKAKAARDASAKKGQKSLSTFLVQGSNKPTDNISSPFAGGAGADGDGGPSSPKITNCGDSGHVSSADLLVKESAVGASDIRIEPFQVIGAPFETGTDSGGSGDRGDAVFAAAPTGPFQLSGQVGGPGKPQSSEANELTELQSTSKDDRTNVNINCASKCAPSLSIGQLKDFDVGTLVNDTLSAAEIRSAVQRGHLDVPSKFPPDKKNRPFPDSLLYTRLANGENVIRDWLVWSVERQSLYCFCCRLFFKGPDTSRPALARAEGFNDNWRKLYEKIPEHQNSSSHKTCYVEWRRLEKSISTCATIDMKLNDHIRREVLKWRRILKRILDITLFLAERGLPYRGVTEKIGEADNGLFLGVCELLARYDPVLDEHLTAVKDSQASGRRMQVSYLSNRSQDEFIECCADAVLQTILQEIQAAKYFSIIVDSTPDTARLEQNVFIVRYVHHSSENLGQHDIHERFLEFVDSHAKTGEGMAEMIKRTLEKHSIPLGNCRGQGYDNASNMSGRIKGASSRLQSENKLAKYSPCAAHSLNLCGTHAVECCPDVVTFFGIVEKVYVLFSSSPQRWELLKNCVGETLHPFSSTRWSARIQSVRPFAAHLPALKNALQDLLSLSLTPEAKADVQGCIKYISSFKCILLSSIWYKALTLIDYRSTVLQARNLTIDVEVENIDGLIRDLTELKSQWPVLLVECQIVASGLGIEMWTETERKRKRKKFFDESESEESDADDAGDPTAAKQDEFKVQVFNNLLDKLLAEMKNRYNAARDLNNTFQFLWKYLSLDSENLKDLASKFAAEYSTDVSQDIVDEMLHLRAIHRENLGEDPLNPQQLLNRLFQTNLQGLFPNVCVALRIFCTIPVSVAGAERSFSAMKRVKNELRSTMTQKRLTCLGMLCLNVALARQVNYNNVIEDFAQRKARKADLSLNLLQPDF